MNLSLNAQATILLTNYFSSPRKGEIKPLTNTEWGKLATWLISKGLSPEVFMEKNISNLLSDWHDDKITRERIMALLNRGHSFALAIEKWSRAGLWVITRSDLAYPKRLKARLKMHAPPVLFGCGNQALLNAGGLAVVGSRKASSEDLSFTHQLGQKAALKGLPIVSGGAKGIDEASMLSTLDNEGFTIGVLADSLLKDSCHSKWRKGLMENRAVLISPFYPEASFYVGNAMARNKYIYCLADVSIVVHSGKTGGTISGAKENLKKQWVPMWVKSSDDPKSANSELVSLGGHILDSNISDLDLNVLFRPLENPTEIELTNHSEKSQDVDLDLVKDLDSQFNLFNDTDDTEQVDLLTHKSEPSTHDADKIPDKPHKEETLSKETLSEEEMSESQHDLFYAIFLNEVKKLAIKSLSENDLLHHLNLQRSQLREWLKRAVTDEKLKKLTRPVRYQWNKPKGH